MISQKARYALRALLYLAGRGEAGPVQVAEIAEQEKIPRKFLEAILLELKKTGIVRSHRGRQGGYSLGRAAKDISFADVLRVTDGPLALSPCVSVMAYRKCDDCFEETVCAIRKALLAARTPPPKSWNPGIWRPRRNNYAAQALYSHPKRRVRGGADEKGLIPIDLIEIRR